MNLDFENEVINLLCKFCRMKYLNEIIKNFMP